MPVWVQSSDRTNMNWHGNVITRLKIKMSDKTRQKCTAVPLQV